ncbi:hypothetical protein [Edaphobacter sp.]|uniref:hypothetical protein n=1 Tax=Edaphobacter sp. TaxID=1934404 RepID=UPI002DB6E872|nr:hypothetical protein [Edaphobacter sp.]HEU5341601.1 hypothetical protein [Edaphobacter sp.]
MQIDNHLPMRIGQPIRAELIYPVYADNKLILPKKTVVTGIVTGLGANHDRRIHARLGGDFTPFHIPVVSFNRIILADGDALSFSSRPVTDGSPIYHAVAPPPSKGGFFRQEFDRGISIARDDAAIFLDPGKGDRFKQFVYNRLPYHPERIEEGTAWTIETAAPLSVPAQPAPPLDATAPVPKRHFWQQPVPPKSPVNNDPGVWIIQAYLDEALSSESSNAGQVIKATVAEPIYNANHTIAIPQGATLVGTVTRAKPARHFGRTGILNFSFRQLTLPGGKPQNVEATLTGADSAQALALNSEGQVKSKPQDKLSVPIFLVLLASRPLDQDRGDTGAQPGKSAAGGAAGLGLVGTIIAISGRSPYAAAGIGYYGAALAFYDRWIARGKKINFPRDTRIVVQTVARHSQVLQPDRSRPAPR